MRVRGGEGLVEGEGMLKVRARVIQDCDGIGLLVQGLSVLCVMSECK